jgi:hypothetical protein
MKVIVAESLQNSEHLLGQFLDESHYDVLIEEDCDGYLPALCDIDMKAGCESSCNTCDFGKDESRIAFKFRKNYFSKELQEQAYVGLREAATQTQNRGLAAGPREEKCGGRDWVSDYHMEVLEYFMDTSDGVYEDDDRLDDIIKHKKETNPSRGQVWLSDKVKKDGFVFDEWVESTRRLSKVDAKKEATRVAKTYISATTYANVVNSGICGWFDRYPRIPYGRATSYTANSPEKFAMAYPFLQRLAEGFKGLLPWRYGNQKRAADKIDPKFLVPETPFTTVTVNKTFRTAAHRDAGDFSDGLSNLLVLSNNGNYKGGYLVFPQIRVAVNVRPGDLLLCANHSLIHGNTEIELLDEEAERISLVCYFRENMLNLGSYEYETSRYNFIEQRRKNPDHPLQRPLWNGVSPDWENSKEWYDFLISQKDGANMCRKYQPDLWDNFNRIALDEFF